MLARGELRITFKTALGGSVVLREQTAPAVIVTAGLFDGGVNCATATAVSDCATCTLRREPFVTGDAVTLLGTEGDASIDAPRGMLYLRRCGRQDQHHRQTPRYSPFRGGILPLLFPSPRRSAAM
jgi:CRP-like cAMP-binding protein